MGEDLKFGEAPGLPAVEHKKKLNKQAAKKAETKVPVRTFYTLLDSKKVVMLTVKPGGLYRSYFGSAKKMGLDLLNAKIKEWKSQGRWVEQGMIDEVTGPIILKLQSEMPRE